MVVVMVNHNLTRVESQWNHLRVVEKRLTEGRRLPLNVGGII